MVSVVEAYKATVYNLLDSIHRIVSSKLYTEIGIIVDRD